jgi:hypothetical protein
MIERADAILDSAERQPARRGARALAERGVAALLSALSSADADAAAGRVRRLRAQHPKATPDQLVERIVAAKGRQTAAVGAASAGAALLPGLGTLAATTIGTTADLTATFKLQAEMVLEIAEARRVPLSGLQQQQLIFLVTGVSTGSNVLLNRAGRHLTTALGRRFAGRSLVKALPIIGLVASSGSNVVATYLIGKHADAYFTGGDIPTWREGLRAITGVDERKIGAWTKDSLGKIGVGGAREERKRRLRERVRGVVEGEGRGEIGEKDS